MVDPKTLKYFECSKCCFKFVKYLTSPVHRCVKCEYPCLDYKLKRKSRFWGMSDEKIVNKLDAYTRMKYYWLKNPLEWANNIHNRQIRNQEESNGKVYLNDDFGNRIGEMPQAIEHI